MRRSSRLALCAARASPRTALPRFGAISSSAATMLYKRNTAGTKDAGKDRILELRAHLTCGAHNYNLSLIKPRAESAMTYATKRPYCDADSHIMETRDWIANFTDPEIRRKLPEMSLLKSGTKSFEVITEAVEKQKQRTARGAAAADVVKGLKGWNAPGAFDAAERKAALDDLGFQRQLVFSTFSASQSLHHEDPDVRYGGIRAHNRAMAAFCGRDSRLIAAGQVSLADPARCVLEMSEGVRLGCGAFWIPGMPVGDKSPGHPEFDVVWQAFCDLNVPFLLHVGPNSPTKIAAYENNGH